MRANLREIDQWLANPQPGAEQVINGRTPYQRVQDLRQQVETQVRGRQINLYNSMREERGSEVEAMRAVLEELLDAVQTMRRDLTRGKTTPDEVMSLVGRSMSELRDLAVDAESIDRSGRMATEMVDTDPAEWEEQQARRFPAAGSPIITTGFLRGEEDSPRDGHGDD
jgi:hypothetical protein